MHDGRTLKRNQALSFITKHASDRNQSKIKLYEETKVVRSAFQNLFDLEGHNVCYLSKYIDNVLLRWDDNIHKGKYYRKKSDNLLCCVKKAEGEPYS